MPAVVLEHVHKIHPLRSARSRSVKQALLSLFRHREKSETVAAVNDISLAVEQGEALGVIGVNGAGKSSLLRLIAGISAPTSGSVQVEGRILPMLELGAGFHPDLSGYENILLQGILMGLPRERVIALTPSIIDFAEIPDFIHMPVKHYSSGMYMRLGFAISVHMDPDILLIDEAFSVGDIYFQEKCFRKILEFQREGRTILLVTHDISVVERLCNKVIWIDKGRIVAQGNPADIAYQYSRAMFAASFSKPVPLVFGEQTTVSKGRYGTGAVTFDYVDLLNEEGELGNAFENGRPLEIRLRYQVRDPLDEADCMIVMQSYRGHGSACIHTHEMQKPVRLNPKGGKISFTIDKLDLAPGRYQMTALLHKGGSSEVDDFYDFHLRLYDFYVVSKPGLSEIAAIDMPVRWHHAPSA